MSTPRPPTQVESAIARTVQERARRSPALRYGAAVLLVVLACAVSIGLEPWFMSAPMAPFYAAVALSAWYGGLGPSLLTTALSVLGYGLFLHGPAGKWGLTEEDAPRVIAFLVIALLLAVLSASRDRAEDALRGSERRFRTMVETANEGVWLIDREARTRYANDHMAALLGAPPDKVAAGAVLDFVFPEDVSAAQERIAANLAGRSEEFDFRFRRADGAEALVLAGTSPVRDGSGKIVGALGLYTDITARRRAETGLAQANERFALAADAVQAMIYAWDLTTGKVERSAGLLSLLGFRPDEVPDVAAWWDARIHPEDSATIIEVTAQSLPDGDRFSREYRVRHRDGHWVWVWEQGRIVHDESGKVLRVIGSVVDITARTEAERSLRLLDDAGKALSSSLDLEETFQRVVSLAVPALADWCFVDLAGEDGVSRRVAIAHADPDLAAAMAAGHTYPDTPLPGGPAQQVIASGVPLLIAQVDADVTDHAIQSTEHRETLRAFGVTSIMVVPLRAGGTVHGALSLVATTYSGRHYDEDDLALAEQLGRRAAVAIEHARLFREAQEAEVRYRGLFEGANDGILVVTADGVCIDVNPALAGMIGRAREDLVGQPVASIAEGGPWSGDEAQRLRRDGQWRGDFALRRGDGSLVPVESIVTTVRLPAGPVHVGVLRDTTERQRLQHMHDEFLSAVAHDLKNPLTTVRGQSQLMRRRLQRGEPLDPARFASGLESIDAAAARMGQLLDELVDIMRLRGGQEIDLNRESTDLVALARRVVDEHARSTERHAIQLAMVVVELTGNWDGPRLERVLGNLLGNAIKYSPQGGTITVRVACEQARDKEQAVLSVADQGVGIPARDLTHIFERFRRAGNVERIAGSGIGLAGAKRIVELHGGAISVTSTEGEGSTFTVRLPLDGGVSGAAAD